MHRYINGNGYVLYWNIALLKFPTCISFFASFASGPAPVLLNWQVPRRLMYHSSWAVWQSDPKHHPCLLNLMYSSSPCSWIHWACYCRGWSIFARSPCASWYDSCPHCAYHRKLDIATWRISKGSISFTYGVDCRVRSDWFRLCSNRDSRLIPSGNTALVGSYPSPEMYCLLWLFAESIFDMLIVLIFLWWHSTWSGNGWSGGLWTHHPSSALHLHPSHLLIPSHP